MSKIDQLCVITDEISQDFNHALKVASEYGVKTVDLRKIWNKNIVLFNNDELEKLKEILNKYEMKVAVITGPFGKCNLPGAKYTTTKKESFRKNPDYNLSLFERLVEISGYFDTPFIRIFSFFKRGSKGIKDRWQKMINIMKTYAEKAEKSNKILLLENDYYMFVDDIKSTKYFFEEIDSDAIKLILDPGNYYVKGESTTVDTYEYFYKKNLVRHIHIKDPIRRYFHLFANFTVVGEGKIDYIPLFKQAIDHGYNGYFSLETHALRKKEKISRASLSNISNWLKDFE